MEGQILTGEVLQSTSIADNLNMYKTVSVDKKKPSRFVAIEWDLTGVVPSNISPQQAASIPIPFATAVCATLRRGHCMMLTSAILGSGTIL